MSETNGHRHVPTRTVGYRDRWERIQASFVDAPRTAVEEADQLVSAVIDAITEDLAAERGRLQARWSDRDASTEELRATLTSYRDLFERLVLQTSRPSDHEAPAVAVQ